MSEQVRFISQRNAAGSCYGYHHQEDNQGRSLSPTQSDIESARRIQKLNGSRGQSIGFTRFCVTIQYYRYAGMKDMGDGRQQTEQWAFLRASESVEITSV